MSEKFNKLKALLKELFQLDQPDLDFGIYRIIHAKAAEVATFLERDLLPQVKTEFAQYKSADKAELQKELTAIAETRILAAKGNAFAPWRAELNKPHTKADGETADYSRLRAHLNRYVARNTFDYFIHKDLSGFLHRELDFYIKNEVMHLDDVENESAPRVEQYLSKIKVIRKVTKKFIAFLAQLEDFQKSLWLKKKFVVETSYCVALKEVPEELYKLIAANKEQLAEWDALNVNMGGQSE